MVISSRKEPTPSFESVPSHSSAEDKRLRTAGIKEAFYADLASGSIGGQVIVFENDDPQPELTVGLTRTHFTKSELGRYGFFPPRP